MATFSKLLLDSYREVPDRVSINVLLAGKEDQPITYKDLVEGAAQWARTFAREGIQPGEVTVLILQHGLNLINAYWGAILHGAIPSIMPFLTEKLQPDRYAGSPPLVGHHQAEVSSPTQN
jgi:acyl-CoA synthetase (AMP-forming)/AMP-acid ligase II